MLLPCPLSRRLSGLSRSILLARLVFKPIATVAGALLIAVCALSSPSVRAQTTFNGGGSMTATGVNGSASSNLSVSGATGSVKTISVTLNGVTSSGLSCCDSVFFTSFVLASPGGTKMVLLGGTGDSIDGDDNEDSGSGLKNSTITIEDGGSAAPDGAAWTPQGAGFTVEPSSYWLLPNLNGPQYASLPSDINGAKLPQTDGTSADGPDTGDATLDGTFANSAANGTWTLYILTDDTFNTNDVVSISGWSLTMTFNTTASDSTVTTVSSHTVNPASTASSITYTATVNDTTNSGTTVSTGTVTFTDNSGTLCNAVPVSNGSASCTVTIANQGLYSIQASYTAGTGFESSTSTSIEQLVEHPSSEPTTNKWCNTNSILVPGQSFSLAYPSVIKVSGYPSGATVGNVEVEFENVTGVIDAQSLLVAPDGTSNLDFFDNGFNQGDSISNGINLNFYDSAGDYPDPDNGPTGGTTYNYEASDTLVPGNTDTFASSPATTYDTSIPQVPGTIHYGYNQFYPTGRGAVTETFESNFNGAPANGTWALYPYEGDAVNETIGGGWCVVLTINPGTPTATTLTSSANPQTPQQPVTLTAAVKAGGSPVTSGGTVTFLENGTPPQGTSGGDNVVNLNTTTGQASFTTGTLSTPITINAVNGSNTTKTVYEGDFPLSAEYSGDTDDNPSTGDLVQRFDNTTTLSAGSGGSINACNAGPVLLSSGVEGAFAPNPSNIFASNMPGTLNTVTLTLNGFFTANEDAIDFTEALIKGPTGAALDFFSNTGDNSTLLGGTTGPWGNLTFEDSASSTVPSSGNYAAGNYKPTAYQGSSSTDTFTSSSSGFYNAPGSFNYAQPHGSSTFASTFGNTNPNGTWSLFFNTTNFLGAEGAQSGWCLNFTQNPVSISPALGHNGTGAGGDFVRNEQAASITVSVANNGSGPTGDPVGKYTGIPSNPLKVTDTLNSALSFDGAVANGTDWTCTGVGQTVTCTNDDSVAQGSSYPLLTIGVNVSPTAPGGDLQNQVSVSGAGVTPANSNTDTITVDDSTTTATNNVSATFSESPQTVPVTATVTSPAGTVNEGTVTFNMGDGGTPVAANVVNGVASANATLSAGDPAGTYTITAAYFDSLGNLTSSSDSSHALTIAQASSATAASNATAFAVGLAQNVTLSATVASPAGVVSEGTVQFTVSQGSTVIGTATAGTVSAGTASVSYALPPTLPTGTYTIQAAYTGTGNFTASLDNTHTLTVDPVPGFVVNTATDDVSGTASNCPANSTTTGAGNCSLRDAVAAADTTGAGAITFDPTVFSSPTTINLGNTIISDAADSINPTLYLWITGPASGVTLDGTGLPTGVSLLGFGQGRVVSLSNLTLTNVQPGEVAALNIYNSVNVTVSNCTLTANFVGINVTSTSPSFVPTVSVSNSSFTNSNNSAGFGGAISATAGVISVSSSTFSGNSATNGGAIYTSGGSFSVQNSTFSNNPGSGPAIGNGGAIFVDTGGSLSVENSTFAANSATNGGGIYVNGTGTVTVTDSTFSGNQASAGGAGLFVNTGTANIQYTTFSGNTSAANGAAINSGGTVTIVNGSISGNSAGTFAGGIDSEGGTFTLTNTIVAGNTGGTNPDGIGGFTSGGHNLIGDGTGMTGLTNGSNGDQVGFAPSTINPQLAALGNYGGPTQTMPPVPGSPAICAGSASAIPSGVTTDQRGIPNAGTTYPGHSGACVDVGSVETQGYTLSFGVLPSVVTVGAPISPAPVVTLTANNASEPVGPTSVPVIMTDASSALSGTTSVTMSAGSATFSDLVIGSSQASDTLTATFAVAPSINLTATSSTSFSSASPVLTLSKTANGSFVQGQTAEWDIGVGNSAAGTTSYGTYTLTDALPGGETLGSYSSDGNAFTCTGVGTGTVSCTTSTGIAAGSPVTIHLVVNVPPASPVQVSNTANLSNGATATASASVTQVPASIAINGNATQSAQVGSAFGSLAVTVVDAGGVGVPGQTVAFTAATGPLGGTGTFSNSTNTISITGNASGVADPGTFTANTIPDTYTVTATAASLPSATFNLTNTPGPFAGFTFSYPSYFETAPNAFIGWPVYVTVSAVDQYGNVVTAYPDTVHVTSTDTAAVLPPDSTLFAGQGTFQATLNTAGPQTFTVTDTSDSISGTTSGILTARPPSFVVTTTADDVNGIASNCASPAGTCSLRDALAASLAAGAGTVTFDATKVPSGSTISLVYGPLDIPDDTSITGSYTGSGTTLSDGVTVSGANATNVFTMQDQNAQGTIDGIAIADGSIIDFTGAPVGGAGIDNDGALTVKHSIVSNNLAIAAGTVYGGAIYSDNDLEISDSTISNNLAVAPGVFGAGIENDSYLNATRVTISGNEADGTASGSIAAGGGLFTSCADITDSTISGNKALGPADGSGEAGGGAIFAAACMTMTDSTLSGNKATAGGFGEGGGILNLDNVHINNSTVSANTSDDGGGIFNDGAAVTLANSILSGNTATTNTDFDDQGTATDEGGNLVGVSGASLAVLGNYGGPTQTMLPLPGSRAICDGLVANIPSGVTTDQRGAPNTNTSYPGYTSGTACVDSGAVQTNYAIAFTGEPSPISPDTVIGDKTNFTAAVTVNENGSPEAPAITVPLTLSGTGTLSGGSASTASGVATYSALQVSSPGTGDALTAKLVLNGSLAISAASSSFNVAGLPLGYLNEAIDASTGSATIATADSLLVTGWAADPADGAPVTTVQILIDGSPVGTATLGSARPDIAARYSNPAYLDSGWTFTLAGSSVPAGTHTVSAVAIDTQGLSTTLPGTTTIVGAAARGGPPVGYLNQAVDANTRGTTMGLSDTLQVTGWAADPANGAPVTQVQILIDGNPAGTATLGSARPDIEARYNNPAYLNSGWTFTTAVSSLSPGTHTVSAVAYNSLSLSTTLPGTTTITIATTSSGPPLGYLGQAVDANTGSSTVASADNLLVSGWAADPHDGAPVTQVQILIDGNPAGVATLGGARPDVEARYNNPAYLNSGWTFTTAVSTLSTGSHTVSAVAKDSANLSTTIGSATFTVAAAGGGPPVGFLNQAEDANTGSSIVASADNLLLSGWAADPRDGAPVTQVRILIDGNPAGTATLGSARPDIEARYNNPAYLNSGWTFTTAISTLSAGTHTVSAVAYDSLGLSTTLPGTATITVAGTRGGPPLGYLNQAVDATTKSSTVASADNLLVTGWAADPHDGAPVTKVQILIDGNPAGTATLGGARPDIEARYNNSAYLDSGWTFTTAVSALSTGTHTVSAVAYDSLNLSTTIGTATFTVGP